MRRRRMKIERSKVRQQRNFLFAQLAPGASVRGLYCSEVQFVLNLFKMTSLIVRFVFFLMIYCSLYGVTLDEL